MNIDEMKSRWQSAKDSLSAGSDSCPSPNRKTSLQRLGDRYSRFSTIGLIVMLCGPGALWNAGIRSFPLIMAYVALVGAASVLDYWLARRIREIDTTTMPVAEVLERTMKCRRAHIWWAAFAMPLVIIWAAALAYTMRVDIYMVYGILFGGAVGLVIGIRIMLDFMADYRRAMRK